MLHLNPRGWTSKQDSIVKLVHDLKPDYINVNETQLQGKNEIHLKAYTTFSKNRTDKIGGGICSAVASNLRQSAVCVGEGGEGDEWLAVRLDHVSPCITVLNCYGEQEGRTGREEVLARWGRLLKELEAIRARGDHCILVGDLNKLVGDDHLGIPGNNPEVTAGGQMVRDLVESGNWVLINSMEEVVQGILLGRGSFIKDPLLYFGGRFLFKLKLLAGVGEKAASFNIALSRSTSRHLPNHPRSVPPFQLPSAPPMNGPPAWNHPNVWFQHPLHVRVFLCFQPDLQFPSLLAVHMDHLLSAPSFQLPSAPPMKGP